MKTITRFEDNFLRVEVGDKFVEGSLILSFGRKSHIQQLQSNYDMEIEGKEKMKGVKQINRKNDIKLYIAKKMIQDWSKENAIPSNVNQLENMIYDDVELVNFDGKKVESLIWKFVDEVMKINGLTDKDLNYESEIDKLFADAEVEADEYREDIDRIVSVLEAGKEAKNEVD